MFAGVEQHLACIDDNWSYHTDNNFARKFLQINPPDKLPQQPAFSQLCGDCIDTSSRDFHRNVTPSQLRKTADSCDLCGMLWKCLGLEKSNPNDQEVIELFRDGSMLMRLGNRHPVLRIYMDPGFKAAPADIQVGFPMLPKAGNLTHFKLLREWLRVCDKDHRCYPRSDSPLPTRVLDVGDHENPDSLRLYCTTKDERGRYIALSHCWGQLKEDEKFCTYRRNIAALCKRIDLDKLPKTFQDAVTVTRGLGIQYLWIDSLCIIQKDVDDWKIESKKMETVFGSAYCTIAASSAKASTEGFLSPRSPVQCVKVPYNSDTSLYICESIDNFHRDVEEGELSKRGWVLQERALSRRTIHFTKEQTYWVCSEGVHCESLIKMQNRTARLLGDAQFPEFVSNKGNRARIVLFRSIFETYSKLVLTNLTDRPVAISGLESRCASAFETEGCYGIFQHYLHRSILWQRSGDKMERINPPPDPPGWKVPSWSWMAYEGGISYMEIPFEAVEWSNAVKWFPGTPSDGIPSKLELQAPVREFLHCTIEPQNQAAKCAIFAEGDKRGWLKFDVEDMTDIQRLKCIVVGRQCEKYKWRGQGQRADEQAHYVLVVMQRRQGRHRAYERVGVGSIQRRHISFQGGELQARIV
ncbi:heterokaryon incompatibility protein-domain-containing protein [Tricladium varicosporioides]|nr:heterokaryon incompatibility protein-domain-containing protein [Hymenoscyphus varicosporioides]